MLINLEKTLLTVGINFFLITWYSLKYYFILILLIDDTTEYMERLSIRKCKNMVIKRRNI